LDNVVRSARNRVPGEINVLRAVITGSGGGGGEGWSGQCCVDFDDQVAGVGVNYRDGGVGEKVGDSPVAIDV